ncbi:endonuclease-reverse transcriptase [Danaus plexippus plexippus]|uniref:Endonuclease-reverse transcriptase n=1 Tax=Danaus plexippus plexippus TaxID=278856 RepID=A0A212FGZ6_DANPL|nr:endonuclease-reverse transcriptase [Danaus plexippus plexippus]
MSVTLTKKKFEIRTLATSQFQGTLETTWSKNVIILKLSSTVKTVTNSSSTYKLEPNEINSAYRLGEKKHNKPRPILVTFITNWRKNDVVRNKKKLNSEIYIKENLNKDILENRKQLLPQLKEKRKKRK